jgi:hypothetical protein
LNLAVSISYLDDFSGAVSLLERAAELVEESCLEVPAKLKNDVEEMLVFCKKVRMGLGKKSPLS